MKVYISNKEYGYMPSRVHRFKDEIDISVSPREYMEAHPEVNRMIVPRNGKEEWWEPDLDLWRHNGIVHGSQWSNSD